MKFIQLFLLVLAFFATQPAKAALLVEPVLGFSSLKFEPSGGSEEKGVGPSVGGRLGYQNLGFQLGLDYLRSNINVDEKNFKNLTTSEWAGFVGFEFPVLIRVYAAYIFSATGDTKFNDGAGHSALKFQSGSGTKLGVGFTGLPFVDINFEYRQGKFDEYKYRGNTNDESTDFSAYMISLSLPFTI